MSDVQQGRILANPFSLHTNQGHSAQDHSQVYVAKANSLEWQNSPPFWLPSSLHPDKRMISFPVGIQHQLGSFRLSAPSDPDDTIPPWPGASFFLNQHCSKPPHSSQGVITEVIFLETLRWRAKASFSLTSPPTTGGAHRKLLVTIQQSWRYQLASSFYLLEQIF